MITWSKFGFPKRLDKDGVPIPCVETPWMKPVVSGERVEFECKSIRNDGTRRIVARKMEGVAGGVEVGGVDGVDSGSGVEYVGYCAPGPREVIVDKGRLVRTVDHEDRRQFDPWEVSGGAYGAESTRDGGRKTVDMAGLQNRDEWERRVRETLVEYGVECDVSFCDAYTDAACSRITMLKSLIAKYDWENAGKDFSGFGGWVLRLNPEKVPAALYWDHEKHGVVLTYVKTDLGLLKCELEFADWLHYLRAAKSAWEMTHPTSP